VLSAIPLGYLLFTSTNWLPCCSMQPFSLVSLPAVALFSAPTGVCPEVAVPDVPVVSCGVVVALLGLVVDVCGVVFMSSCGVEDGVVCAESIAAEKQSAAILV